MQNSKVNTILLVVLIILVGFGLWWMVNKQDNKLVDSDQNYTQTKNSASDTDYQPTQNSTQNSSESVSSTGTSTSQSAGLNLKNPNVGVYTTLFTKEYTEPANYAGHFRLVAPGCGSGCFTLYALDQKTGETYKLGSESYQDWRVRDNVITLTSQGGVTSTYTFNEKTQKFDVVTY